MSLSQHEYTEDILILAGDVTDIISLQKDAFAKLTKCFFKVLFVPGNHDLWIIRDQLSDSFKKLELVLENASEYGIIWEPTIIAGIYFVPLFAWYDFSFGQPNDLLSKAWNDFTACNWGEELDELSLCRHFLNRNSVERPVEKSQIISFSHFMPRLDLMPSQIPARKKMLFPVLGSWEIDKQIRQLGSKLHVYGHSHLNRHKTLDGVTYINNAYGYPHEAHITRKELFCIYET